MTLSALKNIITGGAKPIEICENYQDVLTAQTEEELLYACFDSAEWGYSVGIVTNTLMDGFDQTVLNDNGVFNTGTFTLTNPNFENIFITGDANVTLTFTGNARSRVVVLTDDAVVSITASDNVHLKMLSVKNLTPVILVLNDDASCICEFTGASVFTVEANDQSVFHAVIRMNTVVDYTGNDTSVAVIKMHHHSSINYTTAVGATANIKLIDQTSANGSGSAL